MNARCKRPPGAVRDRRRGALAGPSAVACSPALFDATRSNTFDIFDVIPPSYWAVRPDLNSADPVELRLTLRGAVLIRMAARRARSGAQPVEPTAPLSKELEAALREPPTRPLRDLCKLMRDEGAVRPLVLIAALVVAVATMLVETLLFRAMLDVSSLLNLGVQRLAAAAALLIFAALLLLIQVPIVTESLRLGRQTEIRLRMALLKMPRLVDRYFQSRPISDMADRGHGIHITRQLPGWPSSDTGSVRTVGDACRNVLIDPQGALLAIALVVAALGIPVAAQSLVGERDLRVHNHSAALGGFYLDTLLGLVPVRAHQAERAVRRQHESLLVEWASAVRRRLTAMTCLDGAQSLVCWALAGALLFTHLMRTGSVSGGDLLLVYWTLKLPAIAHTLAMLAQQVPMQRNVLARLMEPLSAPEEELHSASPPSADAASAPVSIAIRDGAVVAAGHQILRDINLTIRPGEHVAIVGASGAGSPR